MMPLIHLAKKSAVRFDQRHFWTLLGVPNNMQYTSSLDKIFLEMPFKEGCAYTSQFCPNLNLIKDKIPVLGLDIVERQVQFSSTVGVGDYVDYLNLFSRMKTVSDLESINNQKIAELNNFDTWLFQSNQIHGIYDQINKLCS